MNIFKKIFKKETPLIVWMVRSEDFNTMALFKTRNKAKKFIKGIKSMDVFEYKKEKYIIEEWIVK